MKKYLAGFIVGIIVALGVTAFADDVSNLIAQKATFQVFVNGEILESDKPVAVINGSTYLPLKATGEALGVDVEWNSKDRRVEIGEVNEDVTNKNIETEVIESTPVPTQAKTTQNNIVSSSKIICNWYYYKSNILPEIVGKFPMVTKDNENYLSLSLFGQNNIIYPEEWPKDGIFSVKLPEKDPVQLLENNSLKYEGRIYVKLSAVGLKARIDGETAYLEWLK